MRIRDLSVLIDLGLADCQLFKSDFVVQVEPGDSVDLVVTLAARLQGELPPQLERTVEHPDCFLIQVATAPSRESFCIWIPKLPGIDTHLLNLCQLYARSS